jgi:hypothetical protein
MQSDQSLGQSVPLHLGVASSHKAVTRLQYPEMPTKISPTIYLFIYLIALLLHRLQILAGFPQQHNVNYCGPTMDHTSLESSDNVALASTEFDDLAQVLKSNEMFEFDLDKQVVPHRCVKGNLRKNLGYWESIGTDRFILDVIEFGYKLPFTEPTVSVVLKNNKSASKHTEFVAGALDDLHKTGRIVQCPLPEKKGFTSSQSTFWSFNCTAHLYKIA